MPRAEMHWDYICLTLLTIATAVLAGVFFVLSIENPETRLSGWAGELSSMMAGLATALYLWMVIRTSRVLFVPQQYGAPRRLERKKRRDKASIRIIRVNDPPSHGRDHPDTDHPGLHCPRDISRAADQRARCPQ